MQGIRKAVIPAAGFGTRLLPITKTIPKEMLPIVDKPVIQYVVEEAVASGIEQIILVVGANKKPLEDYFDTNFELEWTLEKTGKLDLLEQVRGLTSMAEVVAVRQHLPLGNGHAVLAARHAVGDEPFAVFWGDDVVRGNPPVPRQLIDVAERFDGPVVGVFALPKKDITKYGVLEVEEIEPRVYRAHSVIEKPSVEEAPSNLAQIGGFILTPDIFDILQATPVGPSGEIYLADGLNVLMKQRSVYAHEFAGVRHDAGNKLEYLKAIVEFGLQDANLGGQFGEFLRGLKLPRPQ